jgi:hypothetical protein
MKESIKETHKKRYLKMYDGPLPAAALEAVDDLLDTGSLKPVDGSAAPASPKALCGFSP